MQNQTNGEKANHIVLIRVTKSQKERLKTLSEATGCKNVSDYIRTNLLQPDIHNKLNSILMLLQQNTNKLKGVENGD